MKKLIAILAPITLVLSACSTIDTVGRTQTPNQQLGTVALKIAVNAKCTTELNEIQAWKVATALMTAEKKQGIESDICSCVSDKASQSVTAVDLATAALDPNARTLIISNAVTKTINECVAEAVK